MIDVANAVQLIRDAARPLPAESVRLANAAGRVLGKPFIADGDSPPFAKSMMDGFALVSADVVAGRKSFEIVDCVVAGQATTLVVTAGTAVQIMTGAPIPAGADAVVMIEETVADLAKKTVSIRTQSVCAGQNIMARGSIYRCGDQLLPVGHRISAHDIGLLAEAGASQLAVRRAPVVGVISTGNEICSAEQKPGIGQIRNSNGPLLLAMVSAQQARPLDLGTARDDEQSLAGAIRSGLAADVLLLTGGVSAGMLDLVPRVLESLGVRQIFHKVSLKPGKPVWFGVLESGTHRCLVFGLPGNPVSTFVCFQLLVKEALSVLSGLRFNGDERASGQPLARTTSPEAIAVGDDNLSRAFLAHAHEIRGDRPTYWPSRLSILDGRAVILPLDWKGSADQRCLSQANCLAFFPIGNQTYPADTLVEIREL